MGVFNKYDDFARWGDEMESKGNSGTKKAKLKKSWVIPLYLGMTAQSIKPEVAG